MKGLGFFLRASTFFLVSSSNTFDTFLLLLIIFIIISGRVLNDKNLPSEGRVAMLRLLAFGAGTDDIVLILHSDRKEHIVMNYCQDFDRLPIREQEACALFVRTLLSRFSNLRAFFSGLTVLFHLPR